MNERQPKRRAQIEDKEEETRIPVDCDEIPAFADEEEEARFWKTHTLADAFWQRAHPIPENELPIDRSRLHAEQS